MPQGKGAEPEATSMKEEDQMENVKYSYDAFVQNSTEATHHTLEFLQFTQDETFANFEWAHFLTGTHYDDENRANELQIARVRLPKISSTQKSVTDYSVLDRNSHSRLQVVTSIPHEGGEVLKARQNPFDNDIVASLTTDGSIDLYRVSDKTRVGKLLGLTEETFALNWNKNVNGLVASAAGSSVCLWDINRSATHPESSLLHCNQLMKWMRAHGESQVNDVKFSPLDSHLLVTAGNDGFFKVWDLRDNGYKSILQGKASDDALNVATFNNVNRNLIAAAGEESGMVGIWDFRMPTMFLNDLSCHQKQVTVAEWHPTKEQMLVTGSDDGKVFVWDNSKCGEEQARQDYEDGPPEMVFPHETHHSTIEDVAWLPERDSGLMPFVASVETQLTLQIWKTKEEFFEDELDQLENVDRIAIDDLE